MKCVFVTANTIMKKKTTDLFTCFRWTQVTLSGLTREGKTTNTQSQWGHRLGKERLQK